MAQKLDPLPVVPDQPGISKKASQLAVGSRWVDSDKVIFVDGLPEKMPGWVKRLPDSLGDPIRGVMSWMTRQLTPFIAMGTHRKLYIADPNDTPYDVTPIDTSGTLTDPFTTDTASSTVVVEHMGHGRNFGDEVRFPNGSDEIPGTAIMISGAYHVTSVLDDDHYTIEHGVAATGIGTGGGTVNYEYELPIGAADPVEGDGFGAGGYGLGNYGEPAEDPGGGIVFEPRYWSLAPYGDLLMVNPINRGIYVFDPAATPAYQRVTPLANAPTVSRGLFVTPERFVFALGVDNDPMNIKWADQDDPTNWTPGSTSTANSRRLQAGTRIIGGAGLIDFLSGVWTDTALYSFQYTGNQFIYDSKLKGTNCGLVSPMALIVRLGVAYWQSLHGYHMWAGGEVQPIPHSDDIREFVVRGMRKTGFEFKCNAYYSPRYNFILWCYVPIGFNEPGLYALVSLTDFSWATGTLDRTSGTIGPDQRPLLASADGYLYQHEEGYDADGEIMQAYITRALMQLNNGARLGEITGFINDMQRQTGTMDVEISTYERAKKSELLDTERVSFEPDETLVDIHVGGRLAEITIRSAALGGDFRLGAPMLETMATGSRR